MFDCSTDPLVVIATYPASALSDVVGAVFVVIVVLVVLIVDSLVVHLICLVVVVLVLDVVDFAVAANAGGSKRRSFRVGNETNTTRLLINVP